MNIRKCDICKKTIKEKKYLRIDQAGNYYFDLIELCLNCAKPVIKFLKSKNLIKDEKENKK